MHRRGRPGDAEGAWRDHRLVLMTAVCWLATRALVLWLFLDRHSWVTGDVDYFAQSLTDLPETGLARTLVEYPLPGVVVVAFPWLVVEALGAPEAYAEAVLVLSLLADAAFTVLLGLFAGRGRRAAVTVWVLAVPLLGATAYARFDLVPGLLAGTGLLLLASHPRSAATAAALATGFKLWPALVLPALAAPSSTRRRFVAVVGVVGGALAGLSLALAGMERLLSPLGWQAERGLQVEAVAATLPMVGWALSPAPYEVRYGEHNAYEIIGPGAEGMLLASEALSLLVVPALLWLWFLTFRSGREVDLETVAWLALTAVSAFMVTSKVLSPQYLLWLLPLAAAAVALGGSRALRVWAAVLLAATAATQLVFPELYGHLLVHDGLTGWAVLALVVRNLLMVWLLASAATHAVRGLALRGRFDRVGRVGGVAGVAVGGGVGGVVGVGAEVSGEGRSTASPTVPQGTSDGACGDGPTTPS